MTDADQKKNEEKSGVYEFLDRELDVDRRELRHNGELLPVQRKVFDLLLYLLRNRHRAVGKDELQDAIWPGTIVTETALTRAIMKARRSVGDDANTQVAIKTVHGHGYRFIADVKAVQGATQEIEGPMGSSPGISHGEWAELRRRRVFRAAATYAAFAWLFVQVGDIAFDAFEWPKLPLQGLLILLVIGLPITLLFAWFYQLTPQGLRKEDELEALPKTAAWPIGNRVVIGVLLVALGFSLYHNLSPESAASDLPRRVAILPVQNTVDDVELEWARLGLMGFMNRIISDSEVVSVVPARTVMSLLDDDETIQEVNDDLRQKLRRAHGVGYVVLPKLEKQDSLLRFSAVVVSDDGIWEMPGHLDEDATALAKILSVEIVKRIDPTTDSGQATRIVSTEPLANQAYAKGMEQQLSGNLQEAKRLFNGASVLDPKSFWPRYEHAIVTRILGDYDDAEQQFMTLLEESRSAEDVSTVYSTLNGLGITHMLKGNLDQAENYLQEGLVLADQFQDESRKLSLLVNLGIVAKNKGDYAASRQFLGRALDSYLASGVEVVPGSVYNTLANLNADEGDLEKAAEYFQKARDSYRFVGQKRHEATVLNNQAWVKQRLRQYNEAEDLNQASLALREELSDRVGVLRSKRSLTSLYLQMKDYDKAWVLANEVYAAPESQQSTDLLASAVSSLGRIASARGDYETAKNNMAQAIQIRTDRGSVPGVLDQKLKLVRVHLNAANIEAAGVLTRDVLDEARAVEHRVSEVRSILFLGEIADLEDRTQEAIDFYVSANELARGINNIPLEVMGTSRLVDLYL
ncbi:MAG: tetratricopeptide repeat protein, partial [Pseudomonadota bacterium]